MQSLFFGPSSRKLFGEIFPAAGSSAGVIICGSWGPENQASDRFLSVLARRISGNEMAAMKFDYFGCGDSYGNGAETSFTNMIESCEWAIEEFIDSQALTRLCIVGYRLGAAIACRVAKAPDSCVILVDPVLDGNRWFNEVASNDAIPFCREGKFLEIGGFPMGQDLEHDLKSLGIERSVPEECTITSVICSSGSEQVDFLADKTTHCDADPSWVLSGGVGLAPIPSKLIDTTVDELTSCVSR